MPKRKILNLIDNLSEIAKRERWTRAYNRKLDYFCWTKPSISKNVRLVKVSKEVLLYLNSGGIIEGIGVEYLRANFIRHNPNYKGLIKLFTEKLDEATFVISKNKKNLTIFEDFAKVLASDIYKENLEHNRTADDIERLIDVAIEN